LDKLEQGLRPYRFSLEEVVPLFAALLSVPLLERYPPLTLTPQQQKQRTHEALVAWLLEETERQPVLAVWEDLHWADPSTLESLSLVIEQAPTARLLTLLTYRPEFHFPWSPRLPLTPLTLNRFGRAQIEAIPWDDLSRLYGCGAVVAWLSRSGPGAEPRGAHHRPGAVAPL
jgi:predicted ATPase